VRFWGNPGISGRTRRALQGFATDAFKTANDSWKKEAYPTLVENALRQLVAVSPDYLTS
jgi:hypothetical protein